MYMQFCHEAKSCAYWLVNETLWYQTETRPRHLIFSLRRDRDRDLPTFPRDRDIWKLRLETVSRPRRRDRDYIPGIRIPLSTEVGLGSCDIVLDGDPAPPTATQPQVFGPLYSGMVAHLSNCCHTSTHGVAQV